MARLVVCLVGFHALHRTVLANVVGLFRTKNLIADWVVAENWLPGATILVCDIDSVEGRHAWEWCGTNNVTRVAVTGAPLADAGDVIPKPLRAAELQALIGILDRAATTVETPAKPERTEPEAVVAEKSVAPAANQTATADHVHGPKDGKPALRLAWSQPEPAPPPPPPPANVVHFSSSAGMVASHIVVEGTSHRVIMFDQRLEDPARPDVAAAAPAVKRHAEPEVQIPQPIIEPPPPPARAEPLAPALVDPAPPASVAPAPVVPAPVAPEIVLPPIAETLAPPGRFPPASPEPEGSPAIDIPAIDLREFLPPGPAAVRDTPGKVERTTPRHVAPIAPDGAFETFVPSASRRQFKATPRATVADDDRIRMILRGLKASDTPAVREEDGEEDLTTVLARLRSIRKAAVLYFDGIEPICVAATENQFYSKASLREIYDAVAKQPGPARTVVAETVSSGIREAGCYSEQPQDLTRLAWIAALRSRAFDVTQFEGRAYRLAQWPDLVQLPHDPRHMQWCGLLTRRALTPRALQDVNGGSTQDVAAFLTACGELGILERTKAPVPATGKAEPATTETSRERAATFRSLLGRLGIGRS